MGRRGPAPLRALPSFTGRHLAPGSALALSALLAGLPACGGEPGPTVLLVSLDSVRADALGFDDPAVAPNLHALARKGTVFTQAISGSSWTLPTHAQLFTGEPPLLHGVQYDDLTIDPRMPVLPELLAQADWFTAGWWTGWYVAGEYGFERGFALYENAMTFGSELERQLAEARRSGDVEKAAQLMLQREVAGHRDVTSPRVVELATRALQHAAPERGLFLFTHFFDPHYDYVPPEPYDTAFDPDYQGSIDGRDFYTNPAIFDPTRSPARQVSDRDLAHLMHLYRGEIAWTDSQLGLFFDELRRAGRLDSALIVVTADHGEEFFEHGGRGHRHTLFEEQLRVPLLVVLPADQRGGRVPRVEAQVSLSDVFPTILDFADLQPPGPVEGISLLPLLRGAVAPERALVSSLLLFQRRADGGLDWYLQDSLRTPRWKLLRELAAEPGGAGLRTLREVVYELDQDPREQRPQADHPRLAELRDRLNARLEELGEKRALRAPSPLGERLTRVRESFAGELAALGYAGDEPEREGSPSEALPWPPGPHPVPRLPRDG